MAFQNDYNKYLLKTAIPANLDIRKMKLLQFDQFIRRALKHKWNNILLFVQKASVKRFPHLSA